MGVTIAVYVQNKPTIRNSILSARFMVVLSPCAGPLGAETLLGQELYRVLSRGRCAEKHFVSYTS